jgi:hypothetical protein
MVEKPFCPDASLFAKESDIGSGSKPESHFSAPTSASTGCGHSAE